MGGLNGGDPGPGPAIITTALAVLAEHGARATLDDVAERAGLAPDALARSYPTLAALREGVNEHVLTVAARAFQEVEPDAGEDPFGAMADRVTSLMRDHPDALLYVARSTIDGDPDGLALFDAFMAIALARLEELAADGRLDPGLDIEWAALHVVIFNLSTLLFERAIENHLPERLRSPEGIDRWHRADTELFRRGFLRADAVRR